MKATTSLAGAVGLLLATDLVGGLLAVASDVNTWGEAWGSKALLAAPLPMIAVQVALTWLAVRRRSRAAAGLLATACLVSDSRAACSAISRDVADPTSADGVIPRSGSAKSPTRAFIVRIRFTASSMRAIGTAPSVTSCLSRSLKL